MPILNTQTLVFGGQQTVGPVNSPINTTPQSATAVATAASGTIATAALAVSRVSPAAAVAGVILQAGTYDGQSVWVVNEAIAANTVTFAATATSNVAGTSIVIAGVAASHFIWDSGTQLWYKAS